MLFSSMFVQICQQFCRTYLSDRMCQPLLRRTVCYVEVIGILKESKVALHLKTEVSGRKQMEICIIHFYSKEINCKSDVDIRKDLS